MGIIDAPNLPGVTLDPKDEQTLETAFGVTSNAEELVRQNRARYSPELLRANKLRINAVLSRRLKPGSEDDEKYPQGETGHIPGDVHPDLVEHLGHPVSDAVVRGNGRGAVIVYTFEDSRGSISKDTVPWVTVFGSDSDKREASKQRQTDPHQAANAVYADAEAEVRKLVEEARAEAAKVLQEARDEAQKILGDAEQESIEHRERSQEEAAKAAADAEASDEDEKQAAARGGRARGQSSGSAKAGGGK